jgi:hypothetical protein
VRQDFDARTKLGWKDRAQQDYAQARQIADNTPQQTLPAKQAG